MARFRAYISDSSEDENSSESENNARPSSEHEDNTGIDQESTTSSSSDMRQEALVLSQARRKKPKRNAPVDDDDGGVRYSHQIDDEQDEQEAAIHISPASTSTSLPLRPRGDSTMISRARRVGVDAQKMHVMQTSLFRMPEEAAALKTMNPTARHSLRVPLQPLNRKHSRDSDGDGLRFESMERGSFAHDVDPPQHRPSRKYARIEASQSAVGGSEGAIVDAGLAMGRSFRVGWGPGGTLVHLGTLSGPSSTPKMSANSSIVLKTVIPVFPDDSKASPLLSKLLQHHLSHSSIEPDDDGIPFASPSPSALHFSSFVSLFPITDKTYEAHLFRLGQALFDKIDLRLGDSITVDIRTRVASLRRKAAFSSWLEDAVIPAVDADLRLNPTEGPASVAFTLLTGNQVEKACTVAMDGGYLKLATLISQAGGDLEFKEDLKEQLQLWKEQQIDTHIGEAVRKIYALLAGIVDGIVEGSKGGGLEKCSDLDVVKDLDWKRVLGLYLWFSEPVDASISEVFQNYEQLVKNSLQRKIARPLPWFSQQHSVSSSSRWRLPPVLSSPDALYSLIRLHAEPACSLSQILSPWSFGLSPVDYSLPWHLYIILSRCMGVRDFADRGDPGDRGCGRLDDLDEDDEGEIKVEGHSPSADLLASSYAFQLESLGMIQEALFVLLHIEGSAGRKKAIKDLLGRSASELDEWMTRGIVGSLKIPMAWVDEAKAIYALDNGDVYDAYELYITAGLYNSAHDLAVLELAPDPIIRRDLELLKSLFDRFVGHPIEGWNVHGKVFLDYVNIVTRLPGLLDEQQGDAVPDASQNSEIDDLAQSVPKLMGILPDVFRNSSDPRHRAALTEMMDELVSQVDKVRPLALSRIHTVLQDETTKLQHIRSMLHARFLTSINI